MVNPIFPPKEKAFVVDHKTEIAKSYVRETRYDIGVIRTECEESAESLLRINKKLKKPKEGTPDA